jgi:two-component system LytT family sensor kinase
MKSQALAFRQIEWWTITFIFLLMTIVNTLSLSYQNDYHLNEHLAKVMIPIILYVGFYLTHMKLVPNYLSNKNKFALVGFGLLIAFGTGLFTTVLTNADPNISVTRFLRFYFNTMALYAAYLIAVLLVRNILMPPKLRDFQLYNGVRLVLIFIFITVFLIQGTARIINDAVPIIFSVILPITLVAIFYYYKLIFLNFQRGKKKPARWFLALAISVIFLPCFIISAETNSEAAILAGLGIIAFMLFILFPISKLIFKKYEDYLGQITTLTHEVNQGSANLSFLKSQINPHFLFNALNTLYGSALTENAEKTSDGIQKLGDMMRFMLHENLQDKISIKREIEYLRNYLDIQLLRFGKEPNLELTIQIQEDFCEGEIAPMMLIPFIENAFKHGISTKNKSWIKINLRCLKGSIHLDVVNSVHPKKATDDPKDESGIGLDNIRKRLELLYPQTHSLTIVGNDEEHFVHFSLQLK